MIKNKQASVKNNRRMCQCCRCVSLYYDFFLIEKHKAVIDT